MLTRRHPYSATQALAVISPACVTKAACSLASPLFRSGTLAPGFSRGCPGSLPAPALPSPWGAPCLCMAGWSCNVLS